MSGYMDRQIGEPETGELSVDASGFLSYSTETPGFSPPVCPECRQGKCPNCTGMAWDDEHDIEVRCEHDCRVPTDDGEPLFAVDIPVLVEDQRPPSAQQKLTLRQQNDVINGIHPLTRGQLHPQASRDRSRSSGSSDPFSCGTCIHRVFPGRASNRSFPKCDQQGGRYDTHGGHTDVRAWWPACRQYEPTDVAGVSPLTSVGGE